jgi:predicted phage terminase large subunit-like protein
LNSERLLGDRRRGGNWKIRETAGKVFDRSWFEIVDAIPAPQQGQLSRQVRRWDLAATEAELKGTDPDWTVGLKMQRVGDAYYVTDVTRFRKNPAETDSIMKNTASQDGRACPVRWEQEGGATGKRDSAYLVRLFAGYDCEGVRSLESKITRARPAASQAKAGNIKLLRGTWNEAFLQEVHNFPDGKHDDITDTLSGAFHDLTKAPKLPAKQWHG